jgi:hypothetical protein
MSHNDEMRKLCQDKIAAWPAEMIESAHEHFAAAAPVAAPLPAVPAPTELPDADTLIKWIEAECPGVELMSNRRIMSNHIRALAARQAPAGVAKDRNADLATIRDLDAISMAFGARLAQMEGATIKGYDYLLRDAVMRELMQWRSAWDRNSASRAPIDRSARILPDGAVARDARTDAEVLRDLTKEYDKFMADFFAAIAELEQARASIPPAPAGPSVPAQTGTAAHDDAPGRAGFMKELEASMAIVDARRHARLNRRLADVPVEIDRRSGIERRG